MRTCQHNILLIWHKRTFWVHRELFAGNLTNLRRLYSGIFGPFERGIRNNNLVPSQNALQNMHLNHFRPSSKCTTAVSLSSWYVNSSIFMIQAVSLRAKSQWNLQTKSIYRYTKQQKLRGTMWGSLEASTVEFYMQIWPTAWRREQ